VIRTPTAVYGQGKRKKTRRSTEPVANNVVYDDMPDDDTPTTIGGVADKKISQPILSSSFAPVILPTHTPLLCSIKREGVTDDERNDDGANSILISDEADEEEPYHDPLLNLIRTRSYYAPLALRLNLMPKTVS